MDVLTDPLKSKRSSLQLTNKSAKGKYMLVFHLCESTYTRVHKHGERNGDGEADKGMHTIIRVRQNLEEKEPEESG